MDHVDKAFKALYTRVGGRIAATIAAWVARAVLVIAGLMFSAHAAQCEDMVAIVEDMTAAVVLIMLPIGFDYYRQKVHKKEAKSNEELATTIVAGIEQAKNDNVVDFNDKDTKVILDAVLGARGKTFVDQVRNEKNGSH